MGFISKIKMWGMIRNSPKETQKIIKYTKKEIRNIYMITQLKQEFIFVIGLFIGIISGIFGSFFVTSYFRWKDEMMSDDSFYLSVFMLGIIFLFFLFWLWTIHKRAEKKYWKRHEDKGIDD